MRRIFIVLLALAPLVAGCAAIQRAEDVLTIATGKVVTPQAVIIAANAFDGIKATATNYLRLPRCPKVAVCRSPNATPTIIAAIRAGTADRNQLEAALRANPGQNLSLVDVYNDLRNSTSALAALVSK